MAYDDFQINVIPLQPHSTRPYGTSVFDPVARALAEAYSRREAIEVHPMTGGQRRSLTQLFGRQMPEYRVRSKAVGDGFILWLEQR